MANAVIASCRRLRIVNAEIDGVAPLDIRCRDGRVVEVGPDLAAGDDRVLNARGGAVVPGLNDHHIHLFALAAASRSVRCGPPEVSAAAELRSALAAAPGDGWVRGVGYHESVAGILTRADVDALCKHRPVRIQHRSGKMWFLNTAAERALGIASRDGRLFREDQLLRERATPDADIREAVEEMSRRLLSYGVTGLTDATPTNDRRTADVFRDLDICQRVNLMGDDSLPVGSLKVMLDEVALPDYEALTTRIATAHERGRPTAFHCVTRTELVFALSALRDAGTIPGDRIEHASVTDPSAMALLRDTPSVTVVTQPNFIAERGDQYRADVPVSDHDHLYRCRGFLDAGIPLGGGTDAPFGEADPWAAMRAAVNRQTRRGQVIGANESLEPEQALALFTTPLSSPGGDPRRIAAGESAELCLLHRPWTDVRRTLDRADVRATVSGNLLCTVAPPQTRALSTHP